MLQLTLARDKMLVGYGHTSRFSVGLSHKEANAQNGCRPSVFFAPYRDAHHLITRKIHSFLIVRSKETKGDIFVLNFPSGEHVDDNVFKNAATKTLSAHSWLELAQKDSILSPTADIYTQTFTLKNSPAPLKNLEVRIESLVADDALWEKVTLSGAENTFDTFLCSYYEPEFASSSLLMTSYVNPQHALLGSYRHGVWFGLQAFQESQKNAKLIYAQCGEKQSNSSALNSLEALFQGISSFTKDAPFAVSPTKQIAHGHCDILGLWHFDHQGPLILSYKYAPQKEILEQLPSKSFAALKETIIQEDSRWLAKQKPAPAHCSESIKNLYTRSLLTLRQMQDPTGGIIAAPEFQFEFTQCGGYGYCWGRDAGFVTLAMDTCGLHEESANFYRYIAKCQSADGSFLHRHDMQAHLGSSWGFLQPDETGSVVFGLWKHIEMSSDRALAQELKSHIARAAHWLCHATYHNTKLPISGIDLWEEREGIHLYSLAAMIAGIEAAQSIFKFMEWAEDPLWQQRQVELKNLLNSQTFFAKKGEEYQFSRIHKYKIDEKDSKKYTVDNSHTTPFGHPDLRAETEHILDISMIGVSYPYGILDMQKHPGVDRLLALELDKALWVEPRGGIKRYEGDRYRNGNPWILTTLWLALAAAKSGNQETARRCATWAVEHVTKEGLFPEQIDPQSGEAAWVVPLTWSHAMFLLCVQELPTSCW